MDQILQVIGAVLILAGFAGAQFGFLSPQSSLYLLVNLIGSALLAVLALSGRQWGFLLLEGSWAIISLWGLLAGLLSQATRACTAKRTRESQ